MTSATKVALGQFKPVQFEFGKIHMKGGHLAKAAPMTSKTVEGPNKKNLTFIKIALSEAWLVQGATGATRYSSSSFGRTTLLRDLRDRIQKLCDGDGVADDSIVAAVPLGGGDDYDPMAEVDVTDSSALSPSKIKSQGSKRTRYYKNPVVKKIVPLSMPMRCPEEDPQCTELRTISVYIEGRMQIWLDLEDVEWAVSYLYVQNLLKGVPMIPDDSTGPGGPRTSIHGNGDNCGADAGGA